MRMKNFYDIMTKLLQIKPIKTKKIKTPTLPTAAIKLLHTKEAEDVIKYFAVEFTKLKQKISTLDHNFQYRHDLRKIYQELEKLIQLEQEYNFDVWAERPLQQATSQFFDADDIGSADRHLHETQGDVSSCFFTHTKPILDKLDALTTEINNLPTTKR